MVFLFFFLTFIIGSAGVYALLSLVTFLGCIAFSGQWRRFKFAPASIHYATAWWLPLSLVLLFVAIVHRILPSAITSISASVILLAGIVVWSLWLWAGISDTQRVRAPTVRVLGYLLICMLSVGVAVSVLPGFVPRVVVSLTKRLSAGLSPVMTMKITGARTYVLMIDAINHQETPLVIETVKQMGASDEDIVTLNGDKCTLQAIDEEFSDARLTLTEKDKFILYIKGHGSKYGSGSVRVAYGELSSQRVGDFLSRLPTPNTLVVIDSCYGGKFITALRGRVDAVMVTSSDNLNLAYSSTLEEFWKALNNSGFDWDGDKRVSVNEAFWGVYRSMAKQGEKVRARWLKKTETPTTKEMADYRKTIEESGFTTPQLAELGEPKATDFAVQLPGPAVQTAANATTNGVES